jgi:hypothetical protein
MFPRSDRLRSEEGAKPLLARTIENRVKRSQRKRRALAKSCLKKKCHPQKVRLLSQEWIEISEIDAVAVVEEGVRGV